MKKQISKKYILIVSCIILLIVIIFRSFFNNKEEDGGEYYQESSEKEIITNQEAWRLFDYLIVAEREENNEAMTCGDFRDALYSVCGLLDISYNEVVSDLPERLYTVDEDDLLYLLEYLQVYSLLLKSVKEAGKATDINEKHVYVYSQEDKGAEETILVTSEGQRLMLKQSVDYSDIFEYLNSIDEEDLLEPSIRGYNDRIMKVSDCLDKSFTILCAGNEIIYFINESSEKFILHNAWIVHGVDKTIHLFAEGIERELNCKKLSEEITSSIADITVLNGQVVEITVKQGMINGKVLMADDEYMEIEGYGKLKIDPYLRIYKIYDELEMEQTNVVLVGYTNTNFIVIDGKICAALITQKITADNIRVLLKTDNFVSIFHERIIVTSDKSFTVRQGDEEINYAPETELTILKDDVEKGRITIIPESENAKIKILSIKRSSGNPSYRGTIEIADYDGGLIIINDLSMEEYLYAVVPSEMPTSYALEALKVQAVCARSYAYNQLMGNHYRAYGAHVDDSVNYQVYNNIPEDDNAILAVKETYGMVMEHDGKVVTAFYFSTSSGHTASIEDVWENGFKTSYLTGSYQTYDKPYVDLSDEKIFREFILNNPISLKYDTETILEQPSTYDSGYSYYRWSTILTADELTKKINEIIYSRYQANKTSVLTCITEKEAVSLNETDKAFIRTVAGKTFISKPVKNIGNVKNITVIERGSSGIIKDIMIEGDEAVILVSYQTNLRMLLAPVKSDLIRADNTSVKGMTMLPSAYCIIDKITDEGKTAFLITGGGYGHGVGMSQNGSRTMAMEGKNYKEILEHYYKGTELTMIYAHTP